MKKADRKEALKAYREAQKAKFEASLPMDMELFSLLFDYLDEQSEERECQGDFAMTETFLKAHDVPAEPVLEWLRGNGAGCDCEVLLNVEELFE